MSRQDLEHALLDLSKYTEVIKFNISYTDFIENQDLFDRYFGGKGFVMFTGKEAIICFDDNTNVRFYIKNDTNYARDDFNLNTIKLGVIGNGWKDIKSPLAMFADDVKYNLTKIILMSIIYFILITPLNVNFDKLNIINDKLIDITSIFIGMVFVFIGFFYGDKERTISVYKKGIGDKEYKTDKYIINLSISTIVLTLISILVSNITKNSLPQFLLKNKFLGGILNSHVQFWICIIITWIAICILVICFDSLTNYYLKTMRNKYFIDAVDELANERKKK